MKIINTFDQLCAAGGGIAITYRASDSRGCIVSAWQIMRVVDNKIVATDAKAHWYDNNHKTFSVLGHKEMAVKLEEAKQWVKKTYGINGPWKRNRVRDYVLEAVNKQWPIERR